MNASISDAGDFRTALATPGLLNTYNCPLFRTIMLSFTDQGCIYHFLNCKLSSPWRAKEGEVIYAANCQYAAPHLGLGQAPHASQHQPYYGRAIQLILYSHSVLTLYTVQSYCLNTVVIITPSYYSKITSLEQSLFQTLYGPVFSVHSTVFMFVCSVQCALFSVQ